MPHPDCPENCPVIAWCNVSAEWHEQEAAALYVEGALQDASRQVLLEDPSILDADEHGRRVAEIMFEGLDELADTNNIAKIHTEAAIRIRLDQQEILRLCEQGPKVRRWTGTIVCQSEFPGAKNYTS